MEPWVDADIHFTKCLVPPPGRRWPILCASLPANRPCMCIKALQPCGRCAGAVYDFTDSIACAACEPGQIVEVDPKAKGAKVYPSPGTNSVDLIVDVSMFHTTSNTDSLDAIMDGDPIAACATMCRRVSEAGAEGQCIGFALDGPICTPLYSKGPTTRHLSIGAATRVYSIALCLP
jgi:hypothetical protein